MSDVENPHGMEMVWVQNLKGFVNGVFPADDTWKAIFIRQLDDTSAEIVRLRQELAEAREDCTRASELINAAVTDYNEARAKAFKEVITVINQMPSGNRPGMKWTRDAVIAAAIRSIAEKEPT